LKRFPFLDWMRGLAVLVMIQCHTFNALPRADERQSGVYVLSQFVGGMAAPLFLFMAGMTTAFQIESLARRESSGWLRWREALRRAAYIMLIALLFRFTNWLGSYPGGSVQELTRVDILNCMAVAMAAFAATAAVAGESRLRFAALGATGIAMLSPLIANLPWDGAPPLLREYLVPGMGRGHFPFFPFASFVGFGMAAGFAVKRAAEDGMDRLMQWAAVVGFALIFTNQYCSNLPYSIYPKSNFWTDSPTLVLIRTGVILALLAGSYLWTEYGASPGWSWMQTLGKTSLMVYWVHVVIVYGGLTKYLRHTLNIPQTVVATAVLTLAMVGLAAAKLWWSARRAARPQRAAVAVEVEV